MILHFSHIGLTEGRTFTGLAFLANELGGIPEEWLWRPQGCRRYHAPERIAADTEKRRCERNG
jgi:hypothetical protein